MNRTAATLTVAALLTATAAAAVAVPALTAEPGPAPALTATATAADAAVSEAVEAARGSLDPATVATFAALTNPTTAKAAALAAGRPEAAWDKNCVAWDLPEADTDAQAWANDVAETWLDYHGADCPDAITFPDYYVQTITAEREGELLLTLEPAVVEDYWITPRSPQHLGTNAGYFIGALAGEHGTVETVSVTVDGYDLDYTRPRYQ